MGISNPSGSGQWTYLTTLTFAGDASKSATGLAAYNKYLIIYDNLVGSTNIQVNMTLNNYGGTAYNTLIINNTTTQVASSQSTAPIGWINTSIKASGQIQIQGKASTSGGFAINYNMIPSGTASQIVSLNGYCNMTTGEQLNRIDIIASTGNFTTGTFKIYGAS